MWYLLNRLTLLVVGGIIVVFALSLNEVARFAGRVVDLNRMAFTEWRLKQQGNFGSQATCQKQTGKICNFIRCDGLLAGDPYYDICTSTPGTGWKPSEVEIPEAFSHLTSIRLTEETETSRAVLDIDPRSKQVTYALFSKRTDRELIQSKSVSEHEVLRLISDIIVLNFLSIAQTSAGKAQPDFSEPTYVLALAFEETYEDAIITAGISPTLSCVRSACKRDFMVIRNDIIRMWGSPLISD